MNRRFPQALAAWFAAILLPSTLNAAVGDVLSSVPAPGPCPTGLAFQGSQLWVADWEQGLLYAVNPQTGEVLRVLRAPCSHPEGLASDGSHLYISDYESGRIFAFDPDRQVTVRSYPAPEDAPKGLAFGGNSLWLLDDGANTIYEMVPGDGTILNYYKTPQGNCRGLAHDGRYLWVTERAADELYAVRPTDGEVIFLVKTPGPFPCGLTFGQDSIWLVDFQERKIYRLGLDSTEPYRVTSEITRDFRFRYLMRNDGDGTITEASICIAVPYDKLENQAIVGGVKWIPEPTELTADRWGQKVAVYRFQDLGAGDEVSVGYETRVTLGELHYAFFPEDVGGLEEIPKEILRSNTSATSRLQLDQELIQKTAREIVGEEKNPYWMARRIYDWVCDKLKYERVGGWDVPTTLIKRGTGSCSEYAFLYIAFCRAVGIPSRYEGSVVVRGEDASIDDVFHRWCEVYLPGIGWMPVDPSGGDGEWPADRARYFGGLANRYIITTHGGGDSECLGWDYNGHATYTYQGRGTVHEEAFGIWSPVSDEGGTIGRKTF